MSVREEIIHNITSQVNVNIEEVAAVFGVILLVFIMIDRRHNLPSFRLMSVACVASDFMDLTATFVTLTVNGNRPFMHLLVIILNTLNYFGFGFIAYTLFRYLKSYVRPSKVLHTVTNIVNILFGIYIVFMCLNVVYPKHFIIDYDFESAHFCRTAFTYLIGYGLPLILVTASLIIMVLYNREFSDKQKWTIGVGYAIVVAGCVVQVLVDAKVLFAHGTGILAVVILYFSLESPDYKRMAALLNESRDAQNRIKEAQRAREDLFAGMTHEIRTPLNAVLGVNQLIGMEDPDPTVKVLSTKIKREGEQVLRVVNSILDDAKADDEIRRGDTGLPELDGRKVLSIDDTPINLKIIEGLLNQTGAEIVSAHSGREGIEKMQSTHFDLVFIDHQMPVMDGMATMKRMQSMGLTAGTPVIMVTGNDGEEYRRMYMDAGFDGYVKKPVKQEELFAVINDVLGKEES